MIDSLKGKRILITGINGFIGSHLAAALVKKGAIVYGLSKNTSSSKKNLKANILNYSKLSDFVKKSKIQICFHLAAESIVESGQKNPHKTFKVNFDGALNVLECARINNLERTIIASTSHVYGRNRVPYFEGYMPRPTRPYETSKACIDLLAQSYAESFNLPVLIPRFTNIYGPGDRNFNRLIPKTIRTVLSDKSPEMWGGEAKRDYLYIDDAINAFTVLAEVNFSKVGENRVFNFGSSNIISVKDLIKKIIAASDKKLKINKIQEEREGEVKTQYVSWNKARKILGWEPKVDLDEGIRRTVAWYKDFL